MVKFKFGKVLTTCGVNALMKKNQEFAKFVAESFVKHINGDWGDLGEEDKQMNEKALTNDNDRLFSKYIFNGNEDSFIYIITEYDRNYTTIMFPSEY